jgi:GTP cyclohydrolase II/3,4-dihydroxy-2-butanone 4-phosphate synthase
VSGPFARVEEALEGLRSGRMVVVVGGEGGEGGAVFLAAALADPPRLVGLTRLAGGQVQLAIGPEREERDRRGDGGELVAGWRLPTILGARQGLLSRRRPAEAAIDAVRLAGFAPEALFAVLHAADGTAAPLPDLIETARAASLPLISVDELLAYRRHNERLVEAVVETSLPTRHGDFTAIGYRVLPGDDHQVALTLGALERADEVLVRVHPKCVTGDVFHSLLCRCGDRLELSLAMIAARGCGALVYSLREDDGVCAQVLANLGVSSVRLLLDHTERAPRLGDYGIAVTGKVPLGVEVGRRPQAVECVGCR